MLSAGVRFNVMFPVANTSNTYLQGTKLSRLESTICDSGNIELSVIVAARRWHSLRVDDLRERATTRALASARVTQP